MTLLKVILAFLLVSTNSHTFEAKSRLKISQNSSNIIQLLKIPVLKSLNEVLENNDGDRLDYSKYI